ncbi:protein Spindly [Drosophila subpulchrella]|uniref:protein Spindly n=1 Tax=Drosophila subpulchrella TaxID=1486046 RepID=UPI0018A18DB0|nr:protein Spindly [Drosophila subpulchrella]
MFKNLDLSALSVDDIVEEYKLLHDRHQQLKDQSDKDAQRIYELKRSLDTALAVESYLTQELEQLSNQPVASNSGGDAQELEELRRKYKVLKEEQDTLQQDYDAKVEESSQLRNKLAAAERELAERSAARSSDPHEDCLARLNALEQENCELMQKLAEYEDARVNNTFALAEKEKTIECLQDRVSCMEQNLNCKRDELEEKLQLLESCQEQLVDANAKIALLTSAPENNDRKGNSLFAEVDDQRQAMKNLLAAQKKSYLDMKKTFSDSQFEIRRLKRENVAMHTELQACSTIFCSADKTYQNKLNERIRHLMAANESLERQLNLSQERLRQLASEKSVTWLDSMLDFCKRETDELKAQLHSMRIQKAGLEERMRSVQQEMARWRFESLKSRCVLIDRENLLTEHKIGFKPMQAMEFNIKEAELKAALPRIVSVAPSSPSISAQLSTPKTTSIPLPKPTEIILLDTPIKPAVKEEVVEPFKHAIEPALKVKQETKESEIKPMTYSTPIKTIMGVKIKREVNLNLEHSVHVNIKKGTPVNTELESSEIVPKPQMKGTPVKPDFSLTKIENNEETPINLSEPEEDDQKTSETPAKPLMKGTPIKQRLGGIKVKSNDILLETPAKPQRKGTPVKLIKLQAETEDSGEESFKETSLKADEIDCIEITDRTAPQKPQRKGTPVKIPVIKDATNSNVRSILSKKREVFAEDSQKAVKFSANYPIVHNLSPLERDQSEDLAKENTKPTETEESNDIKPTIKRPNIIRRIVLSSRKPIMK